MGKAAQPGADSPISRAGSWGERSDSERRLKFSVGESLLAACGNSRRREKSGTASQFASGEVLCFQGHDGGVNWWQSPFFSPVRLSPQPPRPLIPFDRDKRALACLQSRGILILRPLLGGSVTVTRQILDLFIGVRIPASQPIFSFFFICNSLQVLCRLGTRYFSEAVGPVLISKQSLLIGGNSWTAPSKTHRLSSPWVDRRTIDTPSSRGPESS